MYFKVSKTLLKHSNSFLQIKYPNQPKPACHVILEGHEKDINKRIAVKSGKRYRKDGVNVYSGVDQYWR